MCTRTRSLLWALGLSATRGAPTRPHHALLAHDRVGGTGLEAAADPSMEHFLGNGMCHNLFLDKHRPTLEKEGGSIGELVDGIVFARDQPSPVVAMPDRAEMLTPTELESMVKAHAQDGHAHGSGVMDRLSSDALAAKDLLDRLLTKWATSALTSADPSLCGAEREITANNITNYSEYVPTSLTSLLAAKSFKEPHVYPTVDNRDWGLEHLRPGKWFDTWSVVHAFPAYCGADCVVGALVKPLLSAIHRQKPFVAHGSRFASKDVCGDHVDKLSCFFEPFDACPFNLDADRVDLSNMDQWQQDDLSDALYAREYGYDLRTTNTPEGLQSSGWFWLTSQLFHHLLRKPQERLKAYALKTANDLGLFEARHRPLLALHVRLGDACTDSRGVDGTGRYCYGLQDYMPHVDAMVEKYGIKAVYLASDSAKVVANATEQYPHIKWLSAPFDRAMFDNIFKKGSRYTMIEQLLFENRTAAYELGVSPAKVFDDAMVDTYLASYADAFVGNFASNMDRTAFAMMSAHRSSTMTCLPPFISVGAPWCFDYGNDKGGTFTRNVYNESNKSQVLHVQSSHFWC